MIDTRTQKDLDEVFAVTTPIDQAHFDALKARGENVDKLVIGKSKPLFIMKYPKDWLNLTKIDLRIEKIWDHELDEFFTRYKAMDPALNTKVMRVIER